MNRDDVIRMARESTAPEWWDEPATGWHMGLDLVGFALLVAQHEREECAKLAEDMDFSPHGAIPAAIRARSAD